MPPSTGDKDYNCHPCLAAQRRGTLPQLCKHRASCPGTGRFACRHLPKITLAAECFGHGDRQLPMVPQELPHIEGCGISLVPSPTEAAACTHIWSPLHQGRSTLQKSLFFPAPASTSWDLHPAHCREQHPSPPVHAQGWLHSDTVYASLSQGAPTAPQGQSKNRPRWSLAKSINLFIYTVSNK